MRGRWISIVKIKVLLGKTGLDSQNKKIRSLARGLKEVGGMDVIYTGLYRSMDEIVEEVIKKEIDVVGISTYNGSHMTVFSELKQALEDRGYRHIILFGEGLIPLQDQEILKEVGVVAEIFSPAASTESIIEWINRVVESRVCEDEM